MAKTLIELMVEAGVQWPEGAKYAAQGIDMFACFYAEKPEMQPGGTSWNGNSSYISGSLRKLTSLCKGWNATIVTRDQYHAAVAKTEESILQWKDAGAKSDVIAIHDGCHGGSVQPTTIEQRIDHLRAMEKQAAEMRQALTNDLEAIGLTWRPSEDAYQDHYPAPLDITDWQDLRDGDIVEITGSTNRSWEKLKGQELKVSIRGDGETVNDVYFDEWMMRNNTQWRFIRRQS